MKRNSFVLYTDDTACLAHLSDAEYGHLIRQLCRYVADGTEPVGLSDMAKIGFAFIRVKLDRDMEKYERTCAARREAGRNGGRRRAENEAKQANACFANQMQANQADSECEYDSDNEYEYECECENENENEAVSECEPARVRADEDTHAQTQPNISEVETYITQNRLQVDAQRFCDYYASIGWTVRGSPMRDWRAMVRNWSRAEGAKQGAKQALYGAKPKVPMGCGPFGEDEKAAIRLMLSQSPPDTS